MSSPIKDFTSAYAKSKTVRAHMPGHKGRGEAGIYDITEIKGADSLYEASGIIGESEKNAGEIFGSYKTLYSAGGSTLCIFTMLAACFSGRKTRKAVAARNCHRAFLNACAMLDIDVEWVRPEYESSLISGRITADAVEAAILRAGDPACVYITTPDYLGRLTPLDEIGGVCRKYGCLLFADNAHGAYLRFIKDKGVPLHPLFHGTDACCDSAHKTLPVLTGGAYLHINSPALEKYEGFLKEMMSMFGSSSPSYLILRSLDSCNEFMKTKAEEYFSRMTDEAEKLKSDLSPYWNIPESEPGKLTVLAPPSGLTGYELAEELRRAGVECEYSDLTHTVLMLTGLTRDEITGIGAAFSRIKQPRRLIPLPELKGYALPRRAMSIREAALADSEIVETDKAAGRVCARAVSCCPPGIALVTGGEIFSGEHINILKNYSILKVNVVK